MYENLSFDEYKAIDAVNASSLKPWLISPRHAKWREANPQETDAMILGRAVHSYLLDDDFYDQYACLDDRELIEDILADRPELKNVRACKEYKEAHARWAELNQHKTILKPDQMDVVRRAKHAISEHSESAGYFHGDERRELTLVWNDPHFGVMCKARLDLFMLGRGEIVDFKTISRRPTVHTIEKQIIDHAYHLQYFWYMRGVRKCGLSDAPTMRFCFIQTCDEFDVTWADPIEDMLDVGMGDAKLAIKTKLASEQSKFFPGVCPSAVPVSVPSWALTDNIIHDAEDEVLG